MLHAAAFGILCCVIASPSAAAKGQPANELSVSVASDVASVRFPGTERLSFTVSLRTADRPLEFTLRLTPSSFTTRRAGIATREGATMRLVRGPVGSAPFTLTGSATMIGLGGARGLPACSPTQNRFHGFEGGFSSADLSMPAHAEATLTAQYETGFAPWPGNEHQLTVEARRRPMSVDTLSAPVDPVRSPAVALRGTTGTRITLASTPKSYVSGTKGTRSARLGRAIRVRGTTEPPLRDGEVTLRQVAPRTSALRSLARVTTDRRGRFTYDWKPTRAGVHELWAFSPAGKRRAADHTCPIAMRITRATSTG